MIVVRAMNKRHTILPLSSQIDHIPVPVTTRTSNLLPNLSTIIKVARRSSLPGLLAPPSREEVGAALVQQLTRAL